MRHNPRYTIRLAVATLFAVAVSQLISQPAAHATTIVTCNQGSGTTTAIPGLAVVPSVVTSIGGTNVYGPGSCSGAGITAATATFSGVMLAAVCAPPSIIAGTFNAGTVVVTWTGGSGPATTTFFWTVPAATALPDGTSLVVLVGLSQEGRFHIPLAPAEVTLTLNLGNLTPACTLLAPSQSTFDIIGASFTVVDAA